MDLTLAYTHTHRHTQTHRHTHTHTYTHTHTTPLMVQWLRLCTPNAGDLGSIPDFIFLGSLWMVSPKITVDGDCSHEIKLLLGRKAMTNLDSMLKSRDITFCIVKAMVFPVVMSGCES